MLYKICILLFICPTLFCQQTDNYLTGAQNTGMAGAGITLPIVWAVNYNVATIAQINTPIISVNHNNRYMLKQLSENNMAAVFPTQKGVFGLYASRFGYTNFNENYFNIAYAKKLSNKIFVGIGVSYYIAYNAAITDKISVPLPLISVQYQHFSKLQVALSATNPINNYLSLLKKHTANYLLGVNYTISDNIIVLGSIFINSNQRAVYVTGAQMPINSKFFIRSGIAISASMFSDFERFCFGIGYKFKSIHTDMAFLNHPQLGYSPSISISYAFNYKHAK